MILELQGSALVTFLEFSLKVVTFEPKVLIGKFSQNGFQFIKVLVIFPAILIVICFVTEILTHPGTHDTTLLEQYHEIAIFSFSVKGSYNIFLF